MMNLTDYSTEPVELLEFVPVAGQALHPLPEAFRGRVMIDTVHDGAYIPAEFLEDEDGRIIGAERFRDAYERERDWGASMVAGFLAAALGMRGFYQVNIARVLMDFGRFPGVTGPDAEHLSRYAINYPFSQLLSYEKKKHLLESYYDVISASTDAVVRDRMIKIAIHTYDPVNPSGVQRPHVSLINRSSSIQDHGALQRGLFDPMYPDVLAEFTADRVLLSRISLTLEKHGVPVAHNYPYCLPEGSIEVRSQVWFYFNYLRRRFLAQYPETEGLPGYRRVWAMLMDTNLRSTESEALRSHLHMFRRAPPGREAEFRAARDAYRAVCAFVREHPRIVNEYRFSPERPSSLGIEVRKDLVWEFDGQRPVRPRPENARAIAESLAEAIAIYLSQDRDAPDSVPRRFGYMGGDRR